MRRWSTAAALACLLLITLRLSAQLQDPTPPVNIIIDSDMAGAVDDVGDHAMLWAMVKRGEANVLAVIVSSTNDYSAPTARAIASYYGYPNIPIGAYKGNIPNNYSAWYSYYAQQIASQFGTAGDTRANYADPVTVYRQALANAPDHSVYIVAGGFYEPLKALLLSGSDAISPLTGPQLVAQKVKRLIPAAGKYFPDSGSDMEANLYYDADAASYVAANWPTEVVWIGSDNGWDVVTGPAASADPNTNPVKQAYDLYCDHGKWCPNMIPGWTQMALLYAVRGLGTNFTIGGQNGSTVVWDNTQATPGRNIWSQSPNRQHAFLRRVGWGSMFADQINPLIQAPVSSTNHAPVAVGQSLNSNGSAIPVTLTATDADNDPLTYSVVGNPAHGALTGAPPNLTYTPTAGYAGADSFTFKANDGQTDSNIATVSITISSVNHAPVAGSQSVNSNGSATAITLTATDADNDPLAYSVVTSPAHGTLTGTAPSLTYTPTAGYSGSDSFTFKANDGKTDSNIATVSITISSVNHAPVADSQSVNSNGSATAITLTATDADSDPLAYSVVTNPAHGTLTGTAPNLTYTPTTGYSGSDSFTFKANDGKADSNIATVSIAINHAPVANAQSVSSAGVATAITLTATDADNDPLTYSVVTGPAHGTLTGTAPNLTYTPTSGYAGSDSFTFKANDGKLDSNVATVSITVTIPNRAPVANSQSLISNAVAISVTLTATDADNDPLTYLVVTNPAHGTLSGTAPTLTYTPTAGYGGSDSFTFKANDSKVDSNIATVSITVNRPPVANAQSVTVYATATPITLTATDADGNALTYRLMTNPTHGTLTGTAPNLTYTPTTGYNGNDSFTFRANDGYIDSSTATVNITDTTAAPPPPGLMDTPTPPVNVILDSDLASDVDDVGDHALLWALANRGELKVLALIISSTNDYSAGAARAIAKYYGSPNVLIGAHKGTTPNAYNATFSYYAQTLSDTFNTPGDTRSKYPDAVTVYRQALANAPNYSVYIVSGGYFQPLRGLLQSAPDSISPLTGVQLVTQKVARLVIAGGYNFPDSGSAVEHNLVSDPDAASYVAANWPTQVVWFGTEVGTDVVTGPASTANPATNPIKKAYDLFCGNGQWCNSTRPGWTQVGLLYAVRGGGTNYRIGGQSGSTVVYDSTQATPGRNIWSQSPNRQHAYMEKAVTGQTLANILNPLVQAAPSTTNHAPVANAQSAASSGGAISITLTATDADGDSLTYSVVSNPTHGTVSGTAPNLTYTPTSGYSGSDSFTFKANDGKVDSNIATVTITVTAVTLPTPTIDTKPPQYTNDATPTFAFSDSQSGVTFQCSLSTGSDSYATCTSPITYGTKADGAYTFKVKATKSGSTSTAASYAFTIDTVAPTVTITAQPNNNTNDTTPAFSFSSETGATFTCSLNSTTDYTDCSSPKTYGPLADGSYTFRVLATDLAGNTGSPVSDDFTVDTSIPVVSAPVASLVAGNSLSSTTTTSTPLTTNWTASDSGSGLSKIEAQQIINGTAQTIASLSGSTTSRSYTVSFNALNQFQVRGTDAASNVSDWALGPSMTPIVQQETSSAIAYSGSWSLASLSSAYGGRVWYASAAGATATITFQGRSFALVSTRSYNRGQADIYLDGVKVATIDLYSSATTYRTFAFVANQLTPSVAHTVQVRVLGTRNSSSSGTRVDVDAFVVLQ